MTVAGFYLNKILTPVADLTNKTISDVSTKIDQGDNETLKKLKEVTKATKESVNTAFVGLSDGAKNVGGALGENTQHLVGKKFGDDYNKTFLGADG
jgi:hypothetical protein